MNELEAASKPRKRRRLTTIDRLTTVVCGAKTRSGEPCKRHSGPGKTRCHYHGGAPGTGAPTSGREAWRQHWARKRLEWAQDRVDPRGDAVERRPGDRINLPEG